MAAASVIMSLTAAYMIAMGQGLALLGLAALAGVSLVGILGERALVVVLVIALMVLLVENDASGQTAETDDSIGTILRQDGYLVGFALIYIEESGVPLFIPGDAFLAYVGHRLPHNMPVFLAAWIGFVLAVTFGATNLYLLSRRYGRRLLEHRLAGVLHLTPDRLETAEHSFRRWGPWALIFGRHEAARHRAEKAPGTKEHYRK